MKKISALLLMVVLLFSMSGVTLGAIHPVGSDFWDPADYEFRGAMLLPDQDKWFDTTKTQEGFNANLNLLNTDLTGNCTGLDAEYLKNDQTFAGVDYLSVGNANASLTSIYGEYRFDFGLFAGMDYVNISDGDGDGVNDTIATGGYSLKFGDQGYLAVSMDYDCGGGGDASQILGYEADLLYYLDKAKIFGEVYEFQEVANTSFFLLGGDYRLSDQLTAGAKYMFSNNEDVNANGYAAGVTWSQDALILNAKLAQDFGVDESYVSVNGSYQFAKNWSAGLTLQKYPDLTMGYLVKVSYKTGIFDLNLSINNDYYPLLVAE